MFVLYFWGWVDLEKYVVLIVGWAGLEQVHVIVVFIFIIAFVPSLYCLRADPTLLSCRPTPLTTQLFNTPEAGFQVIIAILF